MSNSIFDILKLLSSFNAPQNSQTQENPSNHNYPFEAFCQNQNTNQNPSPYGENNMLPLIMSLLGKNDLGKIFSQSNENNKEQIKKEAKSPNDEILL